MSRRTMQPRDKRAILMGALVLLPFALFLWVIRPYRASLAETQDALASERAALARERDAVATAQRNPQIQRIADSAMRAIRPRLFQAKDDVMAGAELASYLADVARGSRVWLEEASTGTAGAATEGVKKIRVEIRAESDLAGTLAFLQQLEHGPKLVQVDRLDVSRVARVDQGSEVLSIAATVSAYALSDSLPPAVGSARTVTLSGGTVR